MNKPIVRSVFAILIVSAVTLLLGTTSFAQQDGCWNTNNLAWYPTGTVVPSGSRCLGNNTWQHPSGVGTFAGGSGGQVQTAPAVQYQPPPQPQIVYVADPNAQAIAAQAQADKERLAAELAVAQSQLAASLAANRDPNPLITVGGERESASNMIPEQRAKQPAGTMDLNQVELGTLPKPNWIGLIGILMLTVAVTVLIVRQFGGRNRGTIELLEEDDETDFQPAPTV